MSNGKLSLEERLQLILAILKNPKQMDWYLGQAGIKRATYYKWRSRFFEAGKEGLKGYKSGPKGKVEKQSTPKEKTLEKELKTAKERVNKLATELEVLKKNENWSLTE